LEKRAPVFAEISKLLGSTLDYERALPRIVRLAVPALADLCAIDLLLEDGGCLKPSRAAGAGQGQPGEP